MMKVVVILSFTLAVIHMLLGLVSMSVGVAASIQADVWMAHSVSPIWSGGFVSIIIIHAPICYAQTKDLEMYRKYTVQPENML